MEYGSLFVLGVICYLFGIIIIISETLHIRKIRALYLISYVRLFYSVIYGLTPGAIYTYVYSNGSDATNMAYIDFTSAGVEQLWILFVLSVIAYLFLNLGYLKVKKSRISLASVERNHERTITDRNLFISAILMLILGFVSLMLWTKAFGGPLGILPYANDLRSGRDTGIYNPFSFFMKLCQFTMFASYLFYILWLKQKRLSTLFLFVASVIPSFLYIFANSGRMLLAIYSVTFIVLYEGHKRINTLATKRKSNYIKYGVLAFVALVIMSAGEPIIAMFQYGEIRAFNMQLNPLQILRDEFFFPSVSGQTAIIAHKEGTVSYRFFIDIISGVLAWFPSRLRPDGIERLEVVNTLLHSGTMLYGGLPTDLISVCIYDLGYVGVAIIPFILGVTIRTIQARFDRKVRTDYVNLLFFLTGFYLLKAVAYADFANIMSNIFYVVMGYLLIKFIGRIMLSRGRTNL